MRGSGAVVSLDGPAIRGHMKDFLRARSTRGIRSILAVAASIAAEC